MKLNTYKNRFLSKFFVLTMVIAFWFAHLADKYLFNIQASFSFNYITNKLIFSVIISALITAVMGFYIDYKLKDNN